MAFRAYRPVPPTSRSVTVGLKRYGGGQETLFEVGQPDKLSNGPGALSRYMCISPIAIRDA